MKLEVDDETLDGIVVCTLTESIEALDFQIKRLKKIKNRKSHQEEDLKDALLHIDSLKRTRYYYGGVKYKI